ncbi:CcmD family protein [Gemmatimonadota bacterium]
MKLPTILTLTALAFFAFPEVMTAQGGLPDPQALASQSLRGYTHMFIAYAIAWGLIMAWVVSIARRLGRLEKALED